MDLNLQSASLLQRFIGTQCFACTLSGISITVSRARCHSFKSITASAAIGTVSPFAHRSPACRRVRIVRGVSRTRYCLRALPRTPWFITRAEAADARGGTSLRNEGRDGENCRVTMKRRRGWVSASDAHAHRWGSERATQSRRDTRPRQATTQFAEEPLCQELSYSGSLRPGFAGSRAGEEGLCLQSCQCNATSTSTSAFMLRTAAGPAHPLPGSVRAR